jgi:hypothetical protein
MGPMLDGLVTGGGRVSEVENLGVNFPPKKLRTVVSLAFMHD